MSRPGMTRAFVVWLFVLALTVTLVAQVRPGQVVSMLTGGKSVSTDLCSLWAGTGDPEGAVVGKPCDLFVSTNGNIYQKDAGSGTDNSGWTAKSAGVGTLPFTFTFVVAICQDTTPTLGLSVPASATAPVATCVTGTNTNFAIAAFNDDGAERQLQGHFTLPPDWTGAIDLRGKWRARDTSGSVVWQVATACVADAETSDPSWNTAQAIVDAAKGTTLQQNDFTQTGITTTGCAAGEEFYFKFFRDSDHASDDLATSVDGVADLISLMWTVRRAL